MKKKFNFKLTACVVSLFIGFFVIIFLNEHKFWFFVGMCLLAVSVYCFARVSADNTDRILKEAMVEVEKEIEEKDEPDEEVINEVYAEMKRLKKRKNSMMFTFSFFAIMLVLVAILSLF